MLRGRGLRRPGSWSPQGPRRVVSKRWISTSLSAFCQRTGRWRESIFAEILKHHGFDTWWDCCFIAVDPQTLQVGFFTHTGMSTFLEIQALKKTAYTPR